MNSESKIAILGYGIEGKALAEYLHRKGYKNITVRDKNPGLKIPAYFIAKCGHNYLKNLDDFEIIFRSPGIHILAKEFSRVAPEKISSQTRYFLENCPAFTIGVTGTKGKGTTSTLIYKILKNAGKDVYLGGNIGKPPITFLDRLNKNSIVVLELSSFQLQDLTQSPDIGVILNTTSEHLDYHANINEYHAAKEPICIYQEKKHTVVCNFDYENSKKIAGKSKGKKLQVSTREEINEGAFIKEKTIFVKKKGKTAALLKTDEVGLIGPHNLENILPAVAVTFHTGVDKDTISNTVRDFTGLPHRLECVKKIKGVKYYNDSFSTTPETAIAALRSFPEKKIIILLGGSEKHSDFTELGKELIKNKACPIIYGKTAARIKKSIQNARNDYVIYEAQNFEEAFDKAHSLGKFGDIVLLSPACASFDLFENYKKRGERFRELVNGL